MYRKKYRLFCNSPLACKKNHFYTIALFDNLAKCCKFILLKKYGDCKDMVELNRNAYLSRNLGDFPEVTIINNQEYVKIQDLRYGTNPHQPAAYYKPRAAVCPVGDMKVLKDGKSGLSQTNLEDISYSMNIVKYFNCHACAVMKHVNPSGAAVQCHGDDLCTVYLKARDADARAAFGSVVAFNTAVDRATAMKIMETFVECVVAPEYETGVLDIFNDDATYKLNKHIRVLQCGDLSNLPRFTGESKPEMRTVKILSDGSAIIAEPLLTSIRSIADLHSAVAENAKVGRQISEIKATPEQLNDLLFAWYVNLSVRSNGVVIAKNGQTLAVGTGEQDRVGAVEQAIVKYRQKYSGINALDESVMSSDGFFPFPDAVEIAAEAGITAIICPSGSLRDADVIKRANELNVALYYAPERIFSHH
jgi:AICAR transformylase/IMP cyclohydrolase PurH